MRCAAAGIARVSLRVATHQWQNRDDADEEPKTQRRILRLVWNTCVGLNRVDAELVIASLTSTCTVDRERSVAVPYKVTDPPASNR